MRPVELPVIVVLGAPNDAEGRLLPAAEGRAEAALRVYRRDPHHRLLLTGGFGAHFNQTPKPHFEYVAAYLEAEGVPRSALLGGVPSTNTVDDARLAAEFLTRYQTEQQADAGSHLHLHLKVVTSDFHVARARLLFERAFGPSVRLEMVAAPAALAPAELSRALHHEADAIARLFA
jgi:uncharacterized SAM-binding protein YcdF (DUF218 family)